MVHECNVVGFHCCRYCELVEQHHPKDLLSVEEFLMLRKQVVTKPDAPPTVVISADDDDTIDAAADDSTDEPPPGVDDQPGSDADLHCSDNKSKVCTVAHVLSSDHILV